MIKIKIKPLSVNNAWRGRRFKTQEYKYYALALNNKLPNTIEIPKGKLLIYFDFGFSSGASDWDNCIKQAQDIIAEKYKFNDRDIRYGVVKTTQVKKGDEHISFALYPLELSEEIEKIIKNYSNGQKM